MSTAAATASELTPGALARMIRQAVKDRSYRATPLGLEIARYYRWKKNEWGASPETLRDYEAILAKTALFFADLELTDFAPPVGTERLRECWDHFWGDLSPRTRSKVRSVWCDFFEWAIRERGIYGNPARALKAPRRHEPAIEIFGPAMVQQILHGQVYPADYCAALLILKYGVRRGALTNITRRNFDFERGQVFFKTKGNRPHLLPIVDEEFWMKLRMLEVEAQWQPDDFLLYYRDTRRRRVPLSEATEILDIGKGELGYAWVTKRLHHRKPTVKRVHLWWYQCLENAGLVAKGVTGGLNMHRGRHTAITNLQRSSHDLKLSQMLAGHADIKSTARYAQFDTADLEAAMRALED